MVDPVFRGVGVALVTLFGPDGDVDAKATAGLAGELAAAGVRAIVLAGTTGEAAALDGDERVALVRAVRAELPASSDVAVIAGTGAPSRRQAAAWTQAVRDEGADAVLALSPPGASDVRAYYDAVVGAADGLPVLAYHFPAASAPGIPVDVLVDLPVQGAKDSSGDPDRLLEELDRWDQPIYVGASTIVLMAGALGAAGAILAAANAGPEDCVAAFAGDADAQRRVGALQRATRGRGGIKALTAQRWGTSAVARLG